MTGCNGTLSNNHTRPTNACGCSTTTTFTYTRSGKRTITTCAATFAVAAAPAVSLSCPTSTTAASCQTQEAINTAFTNWLATASSSGGRYDERSESKAGTPNA